MVHALTLVGVRLRELVKARPLKGSTHIKEGWYIAFKAGFLVSVLFTMLNFTGSLMECGSGHQDCYTFSKATSTYGLLLWPKI